MNKLEREMLLQDIEDLRYQMNENNCFYGGQLKTARDEIINLSAEIALLKQKLLHRSRH